MKQPWCECRQAECTEEVLLVDDDILVAGKIYKLPQRTSYCWKHTIKLSEHMITAILEALIWRTWC